MSDRASKNPLTLRKERDRWDIRDIERLRLNALDPEKDRRGDCSSILGFTLRNMGINAYLLRGEKGAFRAHVAEAASLRLRLFERFDAGEPISHSYVTMQSFQSLLDALASADFEIAKRLARVMGGRDEKDHPFAYTSGYALKSFLLNDESSMRRWQREFEVACSSEECRNFRGYPHALKGVLDHDLHEIATAFDEILRGHALESEDGDFTSTPDELLCVWGIGLANLIRHRGLRFEIDDSLIPAELLI